MHQYTKHILSNGTRVILVPHRDTSAATLLALFEVGSRYETLPLNGASHYIEHMMFKGTERRPSSLAITRDLDSVGADYNAFTSKDYTGYYIRLQADRLPLAIDMLEDMLFRSLYRPKDLESERKVILEEIRMYEDNPSMFVEEIMEEELYRGSTLGWRISGTVGTMAKMKRAPLVAYRDRHYVPARTVLAVAGKYDEAELLPLLERTFGARPRRREPRAFAPFSAARAGYRKPRVRLHFKDTEQVQVSFGFPAYAYKDDRMAALSVMSIILGGTMSSRLFMSVRERLGMAYFIRSSPNPYQDTGHLAVQAGLAKDRIHKALGTIAKELARIAAKAVTDEELSRAKEYVKGKMLLNLEDSSHLAEWYAKQELLQRRIRTPEERIARAFAVTKDDVRAVAKDVFRPSRMTVAVIGPYNDPAPFARHADALA
jgi:predicted Zn-dependent peptidase